MTPVPEMFDWDLRIRNMDRAGIDTAVVSLTCPNCYWGSAAVSLKAARTMNDEMAKASRNRPERIQWLCSLPWQHPAAALKELARATKAGACGVMVLANIAERPLTDRISRRSGRRSTQGSCRCSSILPRRPESARWE
jgi:aminocarboxymuconate-semialdehyde decarboxylase